MILSTTWNYKKTIRKRSDVFNEEMLSNITALKYKDLNKLSDNISVV